MARPPGKSGVTRRRVEELTQKGLTPREISLRLGISTQAVYQHLEGLAKQSSGEKAS